MTLSAVIAWQEWLPASTAYRMSLHRHDRVNDLVIAGRWSNHCWSIVISLLVNDLITMLMLVNDLVSAGCWSYHCCSVVYPLLVNRRIIAGLVIVGQWPNECC